MQFKLTSPFQPTGDQPLAIEKLSSYVMQGYKDQVLLGVTGSGKTFTMANVIQNTQKPTLIIAHNKTLAAQLYQEFRDFFPDNAVSYFVSYYDYYQPEAYIPSTDTYIEKDATINDEIDKLRLSSTTNLLTRKDVIVVASVSCIYNLGSPVEYGQYVLELIEGEIIPRESLLLRLADLQYQRNDVEFSRGRYRIRGDTIQVWPAYEDKVLTIETLSNKITRINWVDPMTGAVIREEPSTTTTYRKDQDGSEARLPRYIIYPAKHYMMDPKSQQEAFADIRRDLDIRLKELEAERKIVEAYRLQQKVNYDLEMMQEFGFVNGIENYSRYFDGRQPGSPPFTLIDYFRENVKRFGGDSFLTIIDESHITVPQIRGMHNGDRARKETLIEYGFRLPSALDNRPLTFDEFARATQQRVYVSATPEKYEISVSDGRVEEQLIRPTGLVDPNIEIRPIKGQIEDLVVEILLRKAQNQRVLVTTLTKKMAEALTDYLNKDEKIDALVTRYKEKQAQLEKTDQSERTVWNQEELPIDHMPIGPIDEKYFAHVRKSTLSLDKIVYPKVAYLHSDIQTLERSDILDDLRKGVYDVVVGINLLREGLDLPEVTLVAILDADKEGFLRSRTSLIQTMGRAARHESGHTILYADNLTGSMKAAIEETLRRRTIQITYNQEHGITPTTISKPIRERMIEKSADDDQKSNNRSKKKEASGMIVELNKSEQIDLSKIDPGALTPNDKKKLSAKLKRRMNQAAKDMDFELAAILRDIVRQL